MTSALGTNGSTRAWRKIRAGYELALEQAGSVPCAICGTTIRPGDRWVLGHVNDRALGGGDDALQYECQPCSSTGGAHLGNDIKAAARELVAQGRRSSGAGGAPKHAGLSASLSAGPLPSQVGEDAPVFDPASLVGVPWLVDLLDKPEDAAWPRHMTPVHPEAVGSYGWSLIEWGRSSQKLEPRWWQTLALVRILEHRANGSLCWPEVVMSCSRRSGKSVVVRMLALWRLVFAPAMFEEMQLIVHSASTLKVAKEPMRYAGLLWARNQDHLKVYTNNNNYAIEDTEGGHRWIVVPPDATAGLDTCMGIVDEAWKCDPQVVDDDLEPSLMERVSPQLLLVSTAHRRATSLMRGRISGALAGQDADRSLLLLWAAAPDAEPGDEDAWRAASPYWSPARHDAITRAYDKALRGEVDPEADDPDPMEGFKAQYLNQWRVKKIKLPGNPAVDEDDWLARGVYEPGEGGRVLAVEAAFGDGVCLATAELLPDGRVGVSVEEFGTGPAAAQRATELLSSELSVWDFLAGKSLTRDPEFEGAEPVQGRSRQMVEDLRALVRDDVLVHDRSPVLMQQVEELRVKESRGEVQVVSSGRIDGVKAAVWAALRARELASAEPDIY